MIWTMQSSLEIWAGVQKTGLPCFALIFEHLQCRHEQLTGCSVDLCKSKAGPQLCQMKQEIVKSSLSESKQVQQCRTQQRPRACNPPLLPPCIVRHSRPLHCILELKKWKGYTGSQFQCPIEEKYLNLRSHRLLKAHQLLSQNPACLLFWSTRRSSVPMCPACAIVSNTSGASYPATMHALHS